METLALRIEARGPINLSLPWRRRLHTLGDTYAVRTFIILRNTVEWDKKTRGEACPPDMCV